ncbi:glycoside hydrolase family 10 protein [Caproiciproducens sp. R1]|uniref:glycoside hydrolase family 10 protein n=1 Tax=Caproiciproducens sp. R1 TaxID=3435000 RepID=UPI00403472D1|nr:hypothetical protein [Oscillospiraceae bacterium]
MVIKLFNRHSIFICACILAGVIALTMLVNIGHNRFSEQSSSAPGGNSDSTSASAPAATAAAVPASSDEMRAVWVPYMNLNMSKEEDKSEKGFQKKFDAIVAGAKNCGMNTLIVHVRPFGDALYKSAYFPWSHVVGGTQGVDPGYDPLAYMVTASHKAGLKIQAWINPLRIQVSGTPSILAQGNLYNTWKSDTSKAGWVVDSNGGKYYNPAYPQVRKLIADGAKEIAQNYDVDGIQFDDYFYPTQDGSFDKSAYDAYCASASKSGTPLGLLEWRRGNINAMVSQVYSEIKSVKPNLPFGIAPQGNVQNDMNMGADVASWCSAQGYVDYICPQLYVNFENPVLPFDTAAQSWRKMVVNTNVKLYLGLAVYKSGSDADSGTWKKSNNILAQQVEVGRKTSCDGFMFYSWDYLNSDQTKQEVQNVMKVLNS